MIGVALYCYVLNHILRSIRLIHLLSSSTSTHRLLYELCTESRTFTHTLTSYSRSSYLTSCSGFITLSSYMIHIYNPLVLWSRIHTHTHSYTTTSVPPCLTGFAENRISLLGIAFRFYYPISLVYCYIHCLGPHNHWGSSVDLQVYCILCALGFLHL